MKGISMRLFLLGLLLLRPLAAEPLDLALPGPVKILKAEHLWDGGSVSIRILDAKARVYEVFHSHAEVVPAEEQCFFFKSAKMEKSVRIAKGSADEAKLVRLLRAASVTSYGSSDATYLKNPPAEIAKEHGSSLSSMAILFRRFPEKPPAAPAKTD